MEITDIQIQIWLSPGDGGKKITCCEDAEKIVKKLQKCLEDDGYFMRPEFCGKNPSLHIVMK